jgi:hypothetical protein
MLPSSSTTRSLSPPAPPLDLVNMVYSSSCVLACWCLQVSATTVNLPAILVPRSKPYVHSSPLPVYLHGPSLLDLLYARQPYLCSTPAHKTQPRGILHTNTHAIVSLQSQPRPIIFDNHSSQTRHTRAHINLVFTTHDQNWLFRHLAALVLACGG